MILKKLDSLEAISNAFNNLKGEFHSFGGELEAFCKKICEHGICYAFSDDSIYAVVAFYANDMVSKTAYITSLLVSKDKRGMGLASKLLNSVKEYCICNDFKKIRLEVKKDNIVAINLYHKHGYVKTDEKTNSYFMEKNL